MKELSIKDYDKALRTELTFKKGKQSKNREVVRGTVTRTRSIEATIDGLKDVNKKNKDITIHNIWQQDATIVANLAKDVNNELAKFKDTDTTDDPLGFLDELTSDEEKDSKLKEELELKLTILVHVAKTLLEEKKARENREANDIRLEELEVLEKKLLAKEDEDKDLTAVQEEIAKLKQ